jgi:8-oxo-dGTP diphosphatase
MNVEMVTCVMIQNTETNEVLVQNRKKKSPGWSFPGGHVERGESFYDCAVREVKEETGLEARNLKYCGVVHWVNRDNDERYLCLMYKTTEFYGELVAETDESEQFWFDAHELLATPKEKLSSVHYAFSPLFHDYGRYSEVLILWSGDESTWEVLYK